MASKVSRAAETWRYVLLADRSLPAEEQSVFVLRPMTQAERVRHSDTLVSKIETPDGSRETLLRSRSTAFTLALNHIVDVENFPAGEPKGWPKDRSDRLAYLELLHDDYVDEIGNEVWARSQIEHAVKNS